MLQLNNTLSDCNYKTNKIEVKNDEIEELKESYNILLQTEKINNIHLNNKLSNYNVINYNNVCLKS